MLLTMQDESKAMDVYCSDTFLDLDVPYYSDDYFKTLRERFEWYIANTYDSGQYVYLDGIGIDREWLAELTKFWLSRSSRTRRMRWKNYKVCCPLLYCLVGITH